MNSDGWTTVRRGRGVPFPDAAAAAFGNRRGAGGSGGAAGGAGAGASGASNAFGNSGAAFSNNRVRTGRSEFDSTAASAFGRKQGGKPTRFYEPKKPVEKKVELELSSETLFPSLGTAKPVETSNSSSEHSFASVLKARAEADRREAEERELMARRREEQGAQEELDLASCRRQHRSGRYYGGGYSQTYEDDEYVEDENSLDYQHPYERSYRGEYSADQHEEEHSEGLEDTDEGEEAHDNSAW